MLPVRKDEQNRIASVARKAPDSLEAYYVHIDPADEEVCVVERVTEWMDDCCDPYVLVPREELEAAVFEAVDKVARKYARPRQFFGW